jgi:alanine racemase
MVNDEEMLDLMAVAANCGVLPIVHAENHWMIEYLKKKLLAEGKTEPRYHPHSRPPLAEAEAANRVIALAQLTECPVYLAHLTCWESLEVVRRVQAQGQRVYGEVCTQHLILSEEEYERPGFEGAKFVLSPPLRNKSNWDPLWQALATGTLQVISTDHCPWMFATHKQRGRNDFTQIPNGAPGIETRLPLIYHFGVNGGRLSINKFVELVSTAPARLFGLWPRKGTIAVGSDADVVIFDPHQERTLTAENLHTNVDYSPYEHITVRGYPVMTIARGRVIVKDNEFVGQVGAGEFVERKPFAMEQRSKEQRSKEVLLCSSAPLHPCSLAPLTWAEVDLDAIAHNAREIKRLIGEKTELMAVVKANGYGHGAVPVAEVALDNGASRLAVHRTLEGVELRQAGITAPVLIMGYSLPAEAETIVRWDLTPTVNTPEQAQALSAAALHHGKVLPIHVKVDTGLGRFGLLPDEVVDFVRAISEMPGLVLEGLYTHFAMADAADKAYTLHQFEIYLAVVKRLEEAGFIIPIKHAASSAATLDLPEMHLDMVRCGIALYGLRPSDEVEPSISLRPALALKSRVTRVRTLPAGSCISYGCTYTTGEPTVVALVPVGYGDGYHRLISNRGQVLIRGQRAPILGRVCMDQFVVKVSHILNVQQDDEVVLIGRQGDDEIKAEEVAAWAETINYEVTTGILPRVTRIYTRNRIEVTP